MTLRSSVLPLLTALCLSFAATGCELVADFDREKIPEPERDAASSFDDDASIGLPPRDAGAKPDAGDSGTGGDEDAG